MSSDTYLILPYFLCRGEGLRIFLGLIGWEIFLGLFFLLLLI